MQSNNSCTIHVERVFGPFVSSTCLGGFDFTLVFEETILTILPLSLTCKLSTNARLAIALANTCLQSSCHLGALFNCEMRSQKSINHGFFLSNWSPLSVTLVTSRFFLYLSYLEHTRSVRPSTLLTLYLGLSTLLDLARVRILFYLQSTNHLAAVFLAGFCGKAVMFALELYEKRRLLRPMAGFRARSYEQHIQQSALHLAQQMTGVSGTIVNVITRLRQREIRSSLRYRLWNIFLNAGFYVSSTFAPLWGFGVFILLARSRNTQTLTEPIIFPALTLYELSDQPTVNIPDALEHAQTILNCFERIRHYLVADEQGDSNTDLEHAESKVSGSNEKDESSTTSSQEKHAVVEENVKADVSQKNDLPSTDTIFTARNATAGYSSEKEPVLKALTFDVAKFKTTMVIGPVGCGKSTLLRLLLGEVPETSWIFRGTTRDNIVGLSTWDEPRYKSVVQACCLSADFDILPNGDRTEVGTRGSHLCGGQQMRVMTYWPEELSDIKLDLESSEDVDSTNGEPELDLELPDEILEHMAAAEVEDVNGGRRVGDLKIYAYFIGVAAIWLQWWANANESHPNERIRYWLGVYATIAATAFLGSVASDSVFQLKIVPKMMVEFHRRLLPTTMNATARFITSKDTGTILNRFSQDLNLIDSELPSALDKTVIAILSAFFSAALVFIGSSYVGAAIPLCIGALSSCAAVLARSIDILNSSQKPYYLIWCIQRWLTLVLNLVVAAVAVLLVGLATNIRGGSTGFLGVALFNIVSFSQTLQLVVTEWAHLETAIGAVSRVRSFVLGTEREDAVGETEDLPSEWPKSGSITFTNVSASYEASPRPVLQDINLETKSGERLAICGRTGSDKSSCVSCLFRMLDPDTGSILIDGVDIAKAPRGELRMRLNTVPQQPFFLYGSVRENIDPLSKATDERLIEVLKTVQLWGIFEEHGGLDEDMDSDLLSHGHR
ncbi:hypothetical protein ARSEF4850_005364 [Beauveria asiatica]